MVWIWIALSALAFLYVLQELLTPSKKTRRPPGPRGLPILGHLHQLGKNPHQDLFHLARKHGPIMGMRLGFVPAVVVSSPAGAELILKTHDHVFANRPPHEAAKYVAYEQRNITLGPYGPYWRNMRKLCTLEMLSNLRISQFRAMRKNELDSFVSSVKQAAETRETVDLSSAISTLAGDMNFMMVFGRKYAERDFDEKGFKAVIMDAMEVAARFNLADYFPYIGALDLQGMNGKMKALSKIFDGFLEKIIDDHAQNKQEKKQTKDFVDTMMAIMESGEAEFKFDRSHVKAVLLISQGHHRLKVNAAKVQSSIFGTNIPVDSSSSKKLTTRSIQLIRATATEIPPTVPKPRTAAKTKVGINEYYEALI